MFDQSKMDSNFGRKTTNMFWSYFTKYLVLKYVNLVNPTDRPVAERLSRFFFEFSLKSMQLQISN